jgi:hypothetical protein
MLTLSRIMVPSSTSQQQRAAIWLTHEVLSRDFGLRSALEEIPDRQLGIGPDRRHVMLDDILPVPVAVS